MADWKKNRQKFQMPHDRVERCMRYVKAVEKDEKRAEKAEFFRVDGIKKVRLSCRQIEIPAAAREACAAESA